jgi:hypothetical protein
MGGTTAQYQTGQSLGTGNIPTVNPAAGGSFNFRPLPALQAQSAHPEAIGQGLTQGIESGISMGMSARKNASPSPQAQQQMSLGYQSPQDATQFAQQQTPSLYNNQAPTMQQMVNPYAGTTFNPNTGFDFSGTYRQF